MSDRIDQNWFQKNQKIRQNASDVFFSKMQKVRLSAANTALALWRLKESNSAFYNNQLPFWLNVIN